MAVAGTRAGPLGGTPDRPQTRWSGIATCAAALVLLLAPLAPGALSAGDPAMLIGIPVESIVVILILLAVPRGRAETAAAAIFAAVVVCAVLLGALDAGYRTTVDRPFSVVDDWPGVVSAWGVVRDATGTGTAVIIAVAAVALLVGVGVVLARSAVRIADRTRGTGRPGRVATAAVAAGWMVCSVLSVHSVPGVPAAAADTVTVLAAKSALAVSSVDERRRFESALRADPVRALPVADVLSGLRGHDVVIAFIESYGRVAVQDSAFSAGVDEVLAAGGSRLAQDGYSARSAFLTSPTFGGVSWLAHSTLQSGVWVDSQLKYDALTSGDRVTLARAFHSAGWRTVAVVPSNDEDWDVGTSFYGYDRVRDVRSMGYRGPVFGYARVPDQFTWQEFYETELAQPHPPVMAEIDFVSSHTPWTPLPHLVPWSDLGDGSIFDPQPASGSTAVEVWSDPERVQALYGESVEYSLESMFSFLHTYDSTDLTLIVLGDHQPARIVSGPDADHDVPITIITKDPAVLAAIADWHWEPGVSPSPTAPVWRMDAFRDRFIDAFSRGAQVSAADPGPGPAR